MVAPRIYIKEDPGRRLGRKGRLPDVVKIGHLLEGKMNITLSGLRDVVLKAMNKRLEDTRRRKVEQHSEDWRVTKRYNLINALRRTTKAVRDKKGRTLLLIGEVRFLTIHAPYWRIIDRGGKIMSGMIPGYYGKGNPPNRGGRETYSYRPGMLGGKSPYKTNVGMMLPKKPIKGKRYIAAGFRAFELRGKQAIKESLEEIKRKVRRQVALKKPLRHITETERWDLFFGR